MAEAVLSGLSLKDRQYRSYFQDNTKLVPLTNGSPIVGQIGGGIYFSGPQTYTNTDGVPFTFDANGKLKVDTEISVSGIEISDVKVYSTDDTSTNAVYGKSDADGMVWTNIAQIGSTATAVNTGNVSAGTQRVTLADDDTNTTDIPNVIGTVDSAGPTKRNIQGQIAESTVPTEVSDADVVNRWVDTFGRAIDKATNLSLNANDTNEVSPAILQSINTTNLSAVGSVAGSSVGAWVNMSDFREKTIYYEYASGATAGQVVFLQGSHDAGTTEYDIGSQVFSDVDINTFDVNEDHHEYVRTLTKGTNSGGTLSVNITGRGA